MESQPKLKFWDKILLTL